MKSLPCVSLLAVFGLAFLQGCGDDASTPTAVPTAPTVKSDTDYGVAWAQGVTYGSLTDARDNHVYRTVTIGAQTWMAENLNYRVDSSWAYNNSEDSAAKFGRFYGWTTAMGVPDSCAHWSCAALLAEKVRGLCPQGWHVPRISEWKILIDTAKKDARTASGKESYALKAVAGWYDGVHANQDIFGFRALATGEIDPSLRQSSHVTWNTTWWSVSEDTVYKKVDRVFTPTMSGFESAITIPNNLKISAFPLRCLKD